jgi:NADH:ubiquinone oxidoreductase subunit F (NADH-binding)
MSATHYLLGNDSVLDAASLRDYYQHYSFAALRKALRLSPQAIINELKLAGLRGRGGAAFPTGVKWECVMQQADTVRYVVANGEEGEPGTFKDRLLLEQNPLALIEAMCIAAYTVNAQAGYIYLNHSYAPIAQALEQLVVWLRADQHASKPELKPPVEFNIHVRVGRQRYIAGEETALFRALEGRRAEPSSRPPYPTEKGLWDKPTVINNIETLACVPLIMNHGGNWFAALGPAASPGPKLFCVSGDIQHAGVYEATMDVTLAQLIDGAGGMQGEFKGAFVSGMSGQLLRSEDLHTPLTVQHCVGNGTIIIFNERRCAVDLARHVTNFFFEEHCGQCLPGREAMKQVKVLMDNLEQNETLAPVQQRYTELHSMLLNSSKCGLCSSGTGMTPALMRAYPADFDTHLHGRCARCGVPP